MVQSDKEYRINEKKNKIKYLQYFPADGDGEYLEKVREEEKADKKTCIYCGSSHVRQYDQELYRVCEDCRSEFLDDKQEFESVLWQTQRNLMQLMEVSIDINMGVIYWKNWLQQSKKYLRKSKEKRESFGKDFVGIRKEKKTITFIVYRILPRFMFMYLISGYIIEIFLEKKIPKLKNEVYCPIKCVMMKWSSLHYMYLNGYTNFCRWRNSEEAKDIEYKELTEKIGVPLENNRKDISEIIIIIKEKIEELEGKEKQEEPEKVQHSSDG